MATESDLKSSVDEFLEMIAPVHAPHPRYVRRTIEELRGDASSTAWKEWHEERGVYYFLSAEEIVYVGVGSTAEYGTLGARVKRRIDKFRDGKWGEVTNDPITIVGLIVFEDPGWYWALSLEAFLIERLKPRFNTRWK
jgi:hypothetical protein